jgi:hypothetical protein
MIAKVVKARKVEKSGSPPLVLPQGPRVLRITLRLVEVRVRRSTVESKER